MKLSILDLICFHKKRGFVLRFNFASTYTAMFFMRCYISGALLNQYT